MADAIAKLRAGGTLDGGELALAEGFMVGDAEAYVRLENDFSSWLTELDRLVTVLIHLRAWLEPPQLLASSVTAARSRTGSTPRARSCWPTCSSRSSTRRRD